MGFIDGNQRVDLRHSCNPESGSTNTPFKYIWVPQNWGVQDYNAIPNEVQFDSYTVQQQQHSRSNTIVYQRIDDLYDAILKLGRYWCRSTPFQ